ncbi:MAG: hypothetical protein AABX01_06710 [Candidatus Micrarchaeota archaeon]
MAILKSLKFSVLLVIGMMAVIAAAQFVQTTVIFSVDVSTTFTVFTLGSTYANFTTSKSALIGNYTESYYFNTTNAYAELVQPCSNVDRTSCQDGWNFPAYRIRNTGNVNISVVMNLSTALPATIKLCANSTKAVGCPQSVIAVCDLTSGAGNLNATWWMNITQNVGLNTPCFDTNVSLYANYTGATVGLPVVRVITLNASVVT